MVKTPGLVAYDPDTDDALKSGLEALTSRYIRDYHEFYIWHEQSIVEQNEARVSQLASDFQNQLHQLAMPFQHIQFTSSSGPVNGSNIVAHWTSLALSSYNRQVNEFQIELVERRSARNAAQATRNAAREELAKQANDIPCEEAISVLVQREVAKSLQAQQQKIDATLKPLQDQLAYIIELQSSGISAPPRQQQRQEQQQQHRQPEQCQQQGQPPQQQQQQQQQPLRSQKRPLRS